MIKTKIITFRAETELKKVLSRIAFVTDQTASILITKCIVKYLANEGKEIKKSEKKLLEHLDKKIKKNEIRKKMKERNYDHYSVQNCFFKIKNHVFKQYAMQQEVNMVFISRNINDCIEIVGLMDQEDQDSLKSDLDMLRKLTDETYLKKAVFGKRAEQIDLMFRGEIER